MGKRILIVGAGVIGSLYAMRFFLRGIDVTLLARGERLRDLADNGFRYSEKGTVRTAPVNIIGRLEADDVYDFIFVAVRYDQMESALESLRENQSRTLVTLSNAVTYDRFTAISGSRLLPGFPGAGGDIKDGVLFADFAGKTYFGEIDGSRSDRVRELAGVFERANLPHEIADDMIAFHRTHAAFIAPTRHFYADGKVLDAKTARGFATLGKLADEIKRNMASLDILTPASMNVVAKLPKWVIVGIFKIMLALPFTQDVLLGNHAQGTVAEVALLHEDLRRRA
jgi:2-dehydropantoate 2-reductase